MAKTGYRFNQETLSYDKIHISFKRKLWILIVKFFQSLSLALVIFLTVSSFIDSPKEKALKRENEEILAQYHILNNQINQLNNVLKDLENRDDNIYRVIFESDPIDMSIRRAGSGGVNKYEALKDMDNADLIITTIKTLAELATAMYVHRSTDEAIAPLAKTTLAMLASIPAILPVSLKNKKTRFSSSFGYRIHPIYKTVKLHAGMDFSGAVGTPIYATGNGKVVYAEIHKGYGKTVLIAHGFKYQTRWLL